MIKNLCKKKNVLSINHENLKQLKRNQTVSENTRNSWFYFYKFQKPSSCVLTISDTSCVAHKFVYDIIIPILQYVIQWRGARSAHGQQPPPAGNHVVVVRDRRDEGRAAGVLCCRCVVEEWGALIDFALDENVRARARALSAVAVRPCCARETFSIHRRRRPTTTTITTISAAVVWRTDRSHRAPRRRRSTGIARRRRRCIVSSAQTTHEQHHAHTPHRPTGGQANSISGSG